MEDQSLPLDIISTIPQNVIETILTLMPIRDAVRTSILSTKWRYNWVKIPKLVFDLKQFLTINNQTSERCKVFSVIYQVLLLHQSPILEFTLNMFEVENYFEIDQIIFYLSRNKIVKKFTLNTFRGKHKLSSSFYSLQHLTHLNLNYCNLHPPSTFNGFSRLTSLSLHGGEITAKGLLRLISGCPLLKSFALLIIYIIYEDKEEPTIVQLLEYLPLIEHLFGYQFCVAGSVGQKVPTSLVHLNLHCWDLSSQYRLSLLLLLIKNSPLLEKIKIKVSDVIKVYVEEDITDFLELQGYSDVWLDHLTEFEIEPFDNDIYELQFLKLILVKSPILKKMLIRLGLVGREGEMKILRSFLCFPRASPVVKIIVD